MPDPLATTLSVALEPALTATLAGGVVTYEAGGHQYLAFADGNISRNAFGALGLPSVVIMALDPQRIATAPAAGRPWTPMPTLQQHR